MKVLGLLCSKTCVLQQVQPIQREGTPPSEQLKVHLRLCRIHFNPNQSWSRCGRWSGVESKWKLELGGWENQQKLNTSVSASARLICKQGRGMTLRQETVVAFVSALCLVHQVPQVPQLASYLEICKLVSNPFLLSAKSDCQVLNHKTYKERLGWGRGYPPLYEL